MADTDTPRWPAGTDRSELWTGEGGITGGRPFRYSAHVPPAIAALPLYLSGPAVDVIAEGQRAIDRLEHADAERIVGALATPLLRIESLSSSRIEGLMISHRALAVALEDPRAARGVAKEVANSVRATAEAIRLFSEEDRVTAGLLLRLHSILAEGTQLDDIAGRVRTAQNWIGRSHRNPRGADYVPPPPEEVPGLLDDLAVFCDRRDLPPQAVAAIAHAQFELIHPFADGNGRVGRALIHGVMRRHGATERYAPPVSAALLANSDAYIRGLVAYRQGDVDSWVRHFGTEMLRASSASERLIAALDETERGWMSRAGNPRAGSVVNRAIRRLVEFPVTDVSSLASNLAVDEETARRGMNALEAAGIMKRVSAGKRNRVWAADEVFDLLDSFDEVLADGSTPRRRPTRHRRHP